MRRAGLLLLGALVVAGGCAPPPPAETQASRDAANAAGALWTPEMKAKFKQAMAGHQKLAGGGTKDGVGPTK